MKHFRKIAFAILLGFTLLPALSGAPRSASAASTLTVDDDRVQCPTAAYSTIQAAINAAGRSTTVKVCAGTYYKAITITGKTNLKLVGKGLVRINAPYPFSGSIVAISNSTDVSISGFIIDGANHFASDSTGMNGISVVDSSATITNNSIVNIRHAPLDNASQGIGVYAYHYGAPLKLTIINNNFLDFQLHGVYVRGNFKANVSSNRVQMSGTSGTTPEGIIFADTTGGTISKNTIECDWSLESSYGCTGIQLFEAQTATVADNEISGVYYGIFVCASGAFTGTANGNIISGNTIKDARIAILLYASGFGIETHVDFNKVTRNKISDDAQYGNAGIAVIELDDIDFIGIANQNSITKNIIQGYILNYATPIMDQATNTRISGNKIGPVTSGVAPVQPSSEDISLPPTP
jgi:hypothetical protein